MVSGEGLVIILLSLGLFSKKRKIPQNIKTKSHVG